MARFSEQIPLVSGGDLILPTLELVLEVPICMVGFVIARFQNADAANGLSFAESDDGLDKRPMQTSVNFGSQSYFVDIESRGRYLHITPSGRAGDWLELDIYGDTCRKSPVSQTETFDLATDC